MLGLCGGSCYERVVSMHSDVPPETNALSENIFIVQENDRESLTIDEIVNEVRKTGAVYIDRDGDEIFRYVFEDHIELEVHSSEQTFRADLRRWFEDMIHSSAG